MKLRATFVLALIIVFTITPSAVRGMNPPPPGGCDNSTANSPGVAVACIRYLGPDSGLPNFKDDYGDEHLPPVCGEAGSGPPIDHDSDARAIGGLATLERIRSMSPNARFQIFTDRGEEVYTVTDLEIPGVGFDYKHTRTYRSQETTDQSQGTNWLHNHQERIVMQRGTFIGGEQPLFSVSSATLPPENIWVRAGDYPGDNDRWARYRATAEIDGVTAVNVRLEGSTPLTRGVYFPASDAFTRIELVDTNIINEPGANDPRDDKLVLYSRGGWKRTYKSYPLMKAVPDTQPGGGYDDSVFDPNWSHVEYFLVETQDANGNTMRYNYKTVTVPDYPEDDDSDPEEVVRLASVEDTLGRKVIYDYHEWVPGATASDPLYGRLRSITDFLGRSVNYSYDASGNNLIRVESPRVTNVQVTNNTFTGNDRKTEVYEYTDAASTGSINRRLHHNLIAVYRPNENDSRHGLATDHTIGSAGSGEPALSWTYYCNDRVKTHTIGSGVKSGAAWESGGTFTYTYHTETITALNQGSRTAGPAHFRVVETDPRGNVTRYWYDDFSRGSLVRKEQVTTNPQTGVEEVFLTEHRYNGDNKLNISTTHPSGAITLKDYDSRGISFVSQSNMIRRAEIPANSVVGGNWEDADQAIQEYRYAYDPVYNKPWVEVGPRGTQGVPMPDPLDGLPEEYQDLVEFLEIFAENQLPPNAVDLYGPNADSQPTYTPTIEPLTISPGRYAKEYVFDYQEANNISAMRAKIGVSNALMTGMIARAEEQRALILGITGSVPTRMNLGDIDGNNDGTTAQVAGKIVKVEYPTVYLPDGSTQTVATTTSYDDEGRVLIEKDANGNETHYEYGAATPPTPPVNPDPYTEINKAYGKGFLEKITVDPGTGSGELNLVTTFVRNPLGQVIKATDPRGNVSTTKYNELGQPIRTRSYHGDESTGTLMSEAFTLYDANNNVIATYLRDIETDRTSTAANYSDTNDFNSLPLTDQVPQSAPAPSLHSMPTDASPTGYIGSRTEYNISDLPIRSHVEASHPAPNSGTLWLTTETRYDANEMPAWTKTPLGHITTTLYDQRKLVVQVTSGVGEPIATATTSYYDAAGNLVETIDAVATAGVGEQKTATYLVTVPSTPHWATGEVAVLDVVGLPTTPPEPGQSLAFTSHTGNVTRMHYDGYNRLKRTVDPLGNVTRNFYDPAGNIVETAYFGPTGGVSPTGAAGTNNELLTLTRMRHDELNRNYRTDRLVGVPDGVTMSSGRSLVLYDDDSYVHFMNDGPQPTGYNYPDLNPPPGGGVWPSIYDFDGYGGWLSGETVFDENGNTVQSYDDNGDLTTTVYDAANRPTTVTDPVGNVSVTTYDDNSNVVQVTHTDFNQAAGGNETVEAFFDYDALNRKTRAKADPGGGDIIDYYGYDSRGNPTVHIDARGNVSHSYFDAASRNVATVLEMTTDGTGGTAIDTTQGGGDGRILTRSVYDNDSRLLAQIDDNHNQTRYTYDELNRKTRTDFGEYAPPTTDEETLYGVTATIDPVDQRDATTFKEWQYDKDGNVTVHTDQNGTTHTFTYDGGNRRTQVAIAFATGNPHDLAGTTAQTFQYDGLGRQTYALDNNGTGDDVINRWKYDLLSRTLEESTQIGSFPVRVQSWEYDGSLADAGSGTPSAQRYADNRRVFYAYDANDRLNSITDDHTGASPIVEYKYIGPGTRTKTVERQNGVDLTLGYDDIRRRTSIDSVNTSTFLPVTAFDYAYDPEHQPRYELNSLHPSVSESYFFDSAGRIKNYGRGTVNTGTGALTSATTLPGVTQLRVFKLDGVHNWEQTITLTDNLTAVEDREHTNFNEVHKAPDTTGVTADLTYDDQGNLLRRDYPAGSGLRSVTYHWDGLNRLREVKLASAPFTTLVEYLHATGNQRVSKTVSDGGVPSDSSLNGTIHYYYAGWQLCDEYGLYLGQEAPWFQYVWGPRHADELVCRDERRYSTTLAQLNDGVAGGGTSSGGSTSGGRLFQHHDRGWNVRAVTDETGAVLERYLYDPHGKPTVLNPTSTTVLASSQLPGGPQSGQAYGFTNQRYDRETGLWYFKHRYLDDGLGRFISRDPAGYVDGMNLYTAYFVLIGADPMGLAVSFESYEGSEDDLESLRNAWEAGKSRTINGKPTKSAIYMNKLEESSVDFVVIVLRSDSVDRYINETQGRFIRVTIDTDYGDDGLDGQYPPEADFDLEATLAHESSHAHNNLTGKNQEDTNKDLAQGERDASYVENQNRAARGLPQRDSYILEDIESVSQSGEREKYRTYVDKVDPETGKRIPDKRENEKVEEKKKEIEKNEGKDDD